jgi:hypothetical protein
VWELSICVVLGWLAVAAYFAWGVFGLGLKLIDHIKPDRAGGFLTFWDPDSYDRQGKRLLRLRVFWALGVPVVLVAWYVLRLLC